MWLVYFGFFFIEFCLCTMNIDGFEVAKTTTLHVHILEGITAEFTGIPNLQYSNRGGLGDNLAILPKKKNKEEKEVFSLCRCTTINQLL